LAAAGVSVDPSWKLDGVNLLPYLTGDNTARPHETLYWRFGNQWAIRHGDWKLVVGGGIREPELYNLAADIGESKNLAADEPEKAKELLALYEKWNAEQAPPSAPKEQNAKQKEKAKAKAGAKATKGKQKAKAEAPSDSN
jgi:arylsulfatase A-like enzyme